MSKTYVIDIDGTICDWQAGRDYTLAEPLPDRIKVINYLYDKGNTIKYFTARGMGRFGGRSDKAIEALEVFDDDNKGILIDLAKFCSNRAK